MSKMYRVNFSTLTEGYRLVYRFMTAPGLTRPELSIPRSSKPWDVLTDMGPVTEEDFLAMLDHVEGFETLLCVAGTDEADERRVSLTLFKDMSAAILSFPFSRKLNETEDRLVSILTEDT